ncbi:MAG: Gfo/Idh/MocA family oxidoreductase [Oscillospiraceae bacterium]|jgi:predicted dehydrogenase|nr:Gfo/Idh/MocA family oxidoreductase [Oscillospiraceae bacterium]
MPEKLRIGIIGTGGIAGAHMRSYLKLPDEVEVVAGADIVPGKARAFFDGFEQFQALAFDSAEEMLRAVELDAVSVCTYNQTHACCAVAALEAGLPVLLEKPLCVTMEQAAEILRAEKASGKFVSVGFQPRYDPNSKKIKEIVQSGALGKIYYVQTGGGRRRGIPGHTFIEQKTAGMGALGDIGCYGLDMPLNSLGYPKPLTVSASKFNYIGTNPQLSPQHAARFDVDDFAVALIRLEGGITLDFRMSWAMHMDTTGATFFLGEQAGFKVLPAGGGAWDGTVGGMTLYHDEFGLQTETPIPYVTHKLDLFYEKVSDFVRAVRAGGPAPIPTSQIIYNQAIISGILESAALGREVEITIPERRRGIAMRQEGTEI